DEGTAQFRAGRPLPLAHGATSERTVLFDFYRRLPEEQIRRDGGAEDADEDREVPRRPLYVGDQRRPQRRCPFWMRQNARPDIREEHQRQPFEGARDLSIRGEEEEQYNQYAVQRDQYAMGDARHQLGRLGH